MKIMKRKKKEEKENQALSLRDAMNRIFEESFWSPSEFFSDSHIMNPKTDIVEDEKEVKVTVDVPGVDPEKIDIEVEEGSISLSGKVEEEEEEKEKRYYRYERNYGEFRRFLDLPSKINPEEVSAKVKNGVLTIILPKKEEEKRKKIEIEKG